MVTWTDVIQLAGLNDFTVARNFDGRFPYAWQKDYVRNNIRLFTPAVLRTINSNSWLGFQENSLEALKALQNRHQQYLHTFYPAHFFKVGAESQTYNDEAAVKKGLADGSLEEFAYTAFPPNDFEQGGRNTAAKSFTKVLMQLNQRLVGKRLAHVFWSTSSLRPTAMQQALFLLGYPALDADQKVSAHLCGLALDIALTNSNNYYRESFLSSEIDWTLLPKITDKEPHERTVDNMVGHGIISTDGAFAQAYKVLREFEQQGLVDIFDESGIWTKPAPFAATGNLERWQRNVLRNHGKSLQGKVLALPNIVLHLQAKPKQ